MKIYFIKVNYFKSNISFVLYNQVLFPVLQVFNVAAACSTGNIKAIKIHH